MINLRIAVDPERVLERQLTELERTQIPYATELALNKVAYMIFDKWRNVAPRVFRNPILRTINAGKYAKATKRKLYTEILIEGSAYGDSANVARKRNGTPTQYLRAQVFGGTREYKGIEKALFRHQLLAPGMFAVPGKSARLDGAGNMVRSQFNAIKAQLGIMEDSNNNESTVSKARRTKREAKKNRGDYFVVSKPRGGLAPGVYQRLRSAQGRGVASILHFVKKASYKKRYDIFQMADAINRRNMPGIFKAELEKAVQSTFNKKFGL